MEIQGKVFIVTGGGSGIGREVVFGLLRRGARVAAVDLREAALEETSRLAGAGERLTLHPLDVTDRAGVQAMVARVVDAHGSLDGLLNVAGIGFAPVPGQTAYGASKAAVKLLTEGLYAELRGTQVAVTVVFPGAVNTGISENSGVSISAGSDVDAGKGYPMTSAADAATAIIQGVEKGRYRVVIGKDARMLDRLARLAPRRATEMVAKRMGALLDR